MIEQCGGQVDAAARPAFSLAEVHRVFDRLLNAAIAGGFAVRGIEAMAADSADTARAAARRAAAMRHREWLTENERRLQIRERWAEFFIDFDIMIMPVQPRHAILHDHSVPMTERTVEIDGIERSYMELFGWTGPAGAALLPSTVIPVGSSTDGLPIGVQIVGPYLHDLTTLRFAELLAELTGGCPRPHLAG